METDMRPPGSSPLERLCHPSHPGYRESREAAGRSLGSDPGAADALWARPLEDTPSLVEIAWHWLAVDLLGADGRLPPGRAHVLRAALLVACWELEGDPAAARWVRWHLHQARLDDPAIEVRVAAIEARLARGTSRDRP